LTRAETPPTATPRDQLLPATGKPASEVLTTREACEAIGMGREALLAHMKRGTGPTAVQVMRHYRFHRADLMAWAAERGLGDEPALDVLAVAAFTGLDAKTVYNRLSRGCGPPAIRRGGRLRFHPAAVAAWYLATTTTGEQLAKLGTRALAAEVEALRQQVLALRAEITHLRQEEAA